MPGKFYSKQVLRLIWQLGLVLFPVLNLTAQENDRLNNHGNEDPFERRNLNFTILDSNQIKKRVPGTRIQKKNLVLYTDSAQADTLRLAFALKNKNRWMSFATPFHPNAIPWDSKLINIDNKGRPEIVVRGTVVYEGWPRGEFHNSALLIYQVDTVPRQIFKLYYACTEFNVGGPPENEGAYNYKVEQKVEIKNGQLIIKKLSTAALSQEEKEWYGQMENCHISQIKEGTYVLVNGKFMRR